MSPKTLEVIIYCLPVRFESVRHENLRHIDLPPRPLLVASRLCFAQWESSGKHVHANSRYVKQEIL